MESLNVQFGCGLCAPKGWRNFDASPRLKVEKLAVIGLFIPRPLFPKNCEYGDIVKGLPIIPGTCDVIYSSHVLEHLSLEDLRTALRNAFSILKPGGVFRAVVPDLEVAAQQYLASEAEDRAINFLNATSLGKTTRARTISGWLHDLIGNSNHLWMWDYKGLAAELRNAGFVEIRRACFGDADNAMIDLVENVDRWHDAVGIHCLKPARKD